jgi:metal-sulfur cluster biosynthetic enzyme
MTEPEKLKQDVIQTLRNVIDPETGADVIRMRLVMDLKIEENGRAVYTFRPSSPLCPIALPLVMDIIDAIKTVPGITDQKVTVVDYAGAEELNKILASLPLKQEEKSN